MEQQDNALRDAVPLLLGINYTNVSFERLLFTILPTLLVVALSPFYLRYYYLQPARVLPRTSLWAKLVRSLHAPNNTAACIHGLVDKTAP